MCTRNVFELREVFFIPLMGFGMFYFPLGMNFGRDMIESRNDCVIIKTSLEKK